MAQKIIDLTDVSREEWLKLRQQGLGGSDMATAMNINPWSTKYELYLSKTQPPTENEDNEKMYFGRLLEPMIIKAFCERTGLEVQEKKEMRFHPKHEFIFGNCDGLIIENGKPVSLVEAKNITDASFSYWNEGIPTYYFSQIQNYLDVYGFNYGYLAVLVGGSKLEIMRVERDSEFIEKMYKDCEEFWYNHVVTLTEPELQVVDYEKKEIDNESSKEADREDIFSYGELGSLRKKISELEEQKKGVEDAIKESMKDSAFLTWQGKVLCTWKYSEQERLDTKKLKEQKPEIAEQFIKKISMRKFLYKELGD